MSLDTDFYELVARQPHLGLLLAGISPAGPYRVDSLEVKRARRIDCVFDPLEPGAGPRVYLELQGRHDPGVERRFLEEVVMHCVKEDRFEDVEVRLLYTDRRLLEAAMPADVRHGDRVAVRFSPIRVVLAEVPPARLLERGGSALAALPLTGTTDEVLRSARSWQDALAATTDLSMRERAQAISLFGRLLASRLVTMDVQGLLRDGGRIMEDTATGQALIEKGIEKARREDVARILEERLGPLPAAVSQRLAEVRSLEALSALLVEAVRVASFEEFSRRLP